MAFRPSAVQSDIGQPCADVLNGPLEEERAILELKSAKGAKSRRKAHRLGSMTAKGGMW